MIDHISQALQDKQRDIELEILKISKLDDLLWFGYIGALLYQFVAAIFIMSEFRGFDKLDLEDIKIVFGYAAWEVILVAGSTAAFWYARKVRNRKRLLSVIKGTRLELKKPDFIDRAYDKIDKLLSTSEADLLSGGGVGRLRARRLLLIASFVFAIAAISLLLAVGFYFSTRSFMSVRLDALILGLAPAPLIAATPPGVTALFHTEKKLSMKAARVSVMKWIIGMSQACESAGGFVGEQ